VTDAERSAAAPDAALLHLDQHLMAYVAGRVSLDSVVALCVATLGPRPTLSVSLTHADQAAQARLRALDGALAEIRARTRPDGR
jgi:hypothetical protein